MTQSSYQQINLTNDIRLSWPFSFQGNLATADINNVTTLQVKTACYAATTDNLVALYDNGIAGVGATLTNNGIQTAFSIDGTSPIIGERILVKNQTTFSNWHGIYTVTNTGSGSTNWVLTRAIDYDTPSEILVGDTIPVTNGTVNANTRWAQTTNIVSVGISSPNFTQKNNGWAIILPDATLTSPGQNIMFNNVSDSPFQIMYNDGISVLITMTPGEVYFLYLSDVTTSNGVWIPTFFGGGISAINSIQLNTTGKTLAITNGTLTPPGGKIIIETTDSVSNLVSDILAPGMVVITGVNPSTYNTRTLLGGSNIIVTNGDGVAGDPVLSLAASISGLASIEVGDLQLSGNVITTNVTNGGIQLSSAGTGKVSINGLQIDSNANVTAVNNLTLNGTLTIGGAFSSPSAPKVIFNFTDTSVPIGNTVALLSQYNVASVTGSNGTYTITFTTPLASTNYAINFGLGSNGGTPSATHVFWTLKTTTTLTIAIVDAGGVLVPNVPYGVSGSIYLPT